MTDRAIKEKIQRSMDHSLSGLPLDSFLTDRVLKRAEESKGDEHVVKKISGRLIFAVVLIVMLATAALALTNWEQLKIYFETVRVMDTSGELARWSDEDKIKLLKAMAEAGIASEQDARVKTALDESLSLSERATAADAMIAERYGESYFDSYTVEQLEFPEKKRTQEEQAAYGQWSEEYWTQWDAQEKQPLTESRIYRATMHNLTEIGDFPTELLRDVQVSGVWDEAKGLYTVTASIDKQTYLAAKRVDQITLFDTQAAGFEDGDFFCFQFWLDKHGAFLGIHDVNAPENRAKLTLAEVQSIAEKALAVRLNVDADTLKGMPLRSSYGEGSEYILEEGRFRAVCSFLWGQEADARYYVEIDAQTGRVIKAFDWKESEAMLEKERAWVAEIQGLLRDAEVSDTLYNQREEYFWSWTVEEKAAWSQAARPILQRYLAEHMEFAQYLEDLLANRYAQSDWPNLISLTQYAYGMQDGASISQEQAFGIAREAALEQGGAKRAYVDDSVGHVFYYDVTDPARPLWKVLVSTLFPADDTEHPYDATAAWGYFVVIDAHTGGILHIVERTVNTDIREIV